MLYAQNRKMKGTLRLFLSLTGHCKKKTISNDEQPYFLYSKESKCIVNSKQAKVSRLKGMRTLAFGSPVYLIMYLT